MRIDLGAAILAACFLIPHASAQTVVDPQLDRAPLLTATFTDSDTLVTGGRMRNRPASAMADFYPVRGTGFHLSAGLRFFEARSMLRQNLKEMRDLVYLPWSVGNSGVHWGYRRVPSMAIGYTQAVDEDVTVGIEVGAMMGRATSSIRRFGQDPSIRRNDGRHGANPIVHLLVGVKF
jgi:hypothetical protein